MAGVSLLVMLQGILECYPDAIKREAELVTASPFVSPCMVYYGYNLSHTYLGENTMTIMGLTFEQTFIGSGSLPVTIQGKMRGEAQMSSASPLIVCNHS